MNKIAYLLSNIQNEIPKEVLEMAFMGNVNSPHAYGVYTGDVQMNLSSMIEDKIITNIVLRDCDLYAGTEVSLPLDSLDVRITEGGLLIQIMPSLVGGKRIVSALAITSQYNSSIQPMANITDARLGINDIYITDLDVLPNNTVFARNLSYAGGLAIKVVVGNDNNFGNVSGQSLRALSDLTVLACKMYIYNTLSIKLSGAQNVAGAGLERISSIVDEYADSAAMYKDQLKIWQRVSYVNSKKHRDLLGYQVGKF